MKTSQLPASKNNWKWRKKLSSAVARSCFLRISVSTTAIYSKLFSLTLRKFVLLMWSLDDVIRNIRSSFLKTFGKLLLVFGELFLSIVSKIFPSVNFGASTYKLFLRSDKCQLNICRTFAWMHCFLLTEAAVGGCSSK